MGHRIRLNRGAMLAVFAMALSGCSPKTANGPSGTAAGPSPAATAGSTRQTSITTAGSAGPTPSTVPGTARTGGPASGGPAGASGGPTLAFCPKALNNPYFDQVRKGANAEARRLGLPEPLWIGSTEADAAKQVTALQDIISRGVQGIAISPNAPDSVNGVIKRALARKIPVICFDADAPRSGRLAYVGTDNFAAGTKAGEAMKGALPRGGDVLVVTGGLGAFNLNERIRGFRAGLAGSSVRIASLQACDDDQAKAHQIIQDYLLSHPSTAGIFAVGLWAVLPAGQIATHKGLAGKLKIVGFDTLPEELQLVKDGSVQVLVGQRPYEMGRRSVDVLDQLRAGKASPKPIIDTGTDVVDRTNVDSFLKASSPSK